MAIQIEEILPHGSIPSMCGRYTLSQAERLEGLYAERDLELVPRYNIAPTQVVPVVLDESPGRLSAARWGLIPIWAKDKKIASSLINARCETVAVKPAFRTAFKKRRCLIPADGFYEWKKKVGATKIPHRITVGDGLFYFAGLWETWNDPESGPLRSCTIDGLLSRRNRLIRPSNRAACPTWLRMTR